MPDQQQFVQTASLISDTARKLQSTKQKDSLIVSRFFLLWAKNSWWVSPWTTCRWLIVILGCFPHVTQKTRWIDLRIQCSVSPGRIQVWFIGRAVVECCRGNRQEGECSAAPAKDRLLQKWVTLSRSLSLSLSSRIHSHLAQHIRKYVARVIALCRFLASVSRWLSVPAQRQPRTRFTLSQQRSPQFDSKETEPPNQSVVEWLIK